MLSVLQVATAALLLDGTAGLSLGFLNGGSSFFEPIEVGFRAKAKLLGVDTVYSRVGSSSKCNEEKSDIVREFLELGVDGIAMKPCGLTEGFDYLDIAEKAGIPIITFDSDVANSTRKAYIGTENEFMGRTMARLLRQLRPEGGTYAIVAPKVGRLEGFVEEITKNNDRKNKAHWHEVHRDFPLSISGTNLTYMDQMELYALENPTAIITMKQSPMKHPNWTQFVDKNRHKNITYVGSDGSPLQLDYLDRRYVDGLVGQLPYEIGSDAAKLLYDIVAKDKMPEKEIYHTNLVAYNLIPKDLPPLQLDENLIGKSKYVGYTCFGIIALSSLACVAWTLYNSDRVVVRAAQPFFLLMVAAGVLVISGSLIPLSMDDGGEPDAMSNAEAVGICMSIPWLSFTGFTVAFSALFSKTWRVNRLFRASEHIKNEDRSEGHSCSNGMPSGWQLYCPHLLDRARSFNICTRARRGHGLLEQRNCILRSMPFGPSGTIFGPIGIAQRERTWNCLLAGIPDAGDEIGILRSQVHCADCVLHGPGFLVGDTDLGYRSRYARGLLPHLDIHDFLSVHGDVVPHLPSEGLYADKLRWNGSSAAKTKTNVKASQGRECSV